MTAITEPWPSPQSDEFHARPDGTVPCTNFCGQDVKDDGAGWWKHLDGTVECDVTPYEGQCACPEVRNDDT